MIDHLLRTLRSDERAFDVLRALCDDVGPRFPCTPGDIAAQDWATKAMRAAGLVNVRTEVASATWMAELRASAATARAADQVAEAAGPYNGAAVASRTLDELVALAPGYVGSYVAWLEDLASLADLPERRSSRRKS